MLVISSQSKRVLLETDCIVTGAEIGRKPNCIYAMNGKFVLDLGKYKSEDRAIAVIHDIRRQIESRVESDSMENRNRIMQKYVLQMPGE